MAKFEIEIEKAKLLKQWSTQQRLKIVNFPLENRIRIKIYSPGEIAKEKLVALQQSEPMVPENRHNLGTFTGVVREGI